MEDGKVVVYSAENKKNKLFLLAGNKASFLKNSKFIKEKITSNSFAWVTKKLSFEETPLKKLNEDISAYFNKVVVIPPELENCLFTGELNELPDILSISIEGSYKIRNDTVFITGSSCNTSYDIEDNSYKLTTG